MTKAQHDFAVKSSHDATKCMPDNVATDKLLVSTAWSMLLRINFFTVYFIVARCPCEMNVSEQHCMDLPTPFGAAWQRGAYFAASGASAPTKRIRRSRMLAIFSRKTGHVARLATRPATWHMWYRTESVGLS